MVSSLARRLTVTSTAAALVALALSNVSAVADTGTVSETLPAGGTVSTGATVSPDHPVQLSLTTDTGGTLTINTVDLPAGTARNTLGADDHTRYFNPRFVVPAGGAHISSMTLLIDGSLVPGSTQYHGPLYVEVPEVWLQFTDLNATNAAGPSRVDVTKLPDGNLSYTQNVGAVGSATGDSPGFMLDVGRPKLEGYGAFFGTGSVLASRRSAHDLLLGALYAHGSCTVFCKDKSTITLSLLDARWLGVTNRVLASSALLGMTYAHDGHLPLTLNGRAVIARALTKQRALKTVCTVSRAANGWITTTCRPPAIRIMTATVRTVITGTVPGDQIVKTGLMKISLI
ncbi:MAG: hypothetical protein JWO88_1272 [Frankiales bacterium]|nr:hypothetical protein [Frankiales bacterium]